MYIYVYMYMYTHTYNYPTDVWMCLKMGYTVLPQINKLTERMMFTNILLLGAICKKKHEPHRVAQYESI